MKGNGGSGGKYSGETLDYIRNIISKENVLKVALKRERERGKTEKEINRWRGQV